MKIRKKEKPQQQQAQAEAAVNGEEGKADAEPEWEEDKVSEDGAIWPIQGGQIVDWQCFYALMTHVYNTVNPAFHTPVLLISEPVWTLKDNERGDADSSSKSSSAPAFTIMDSAMASFYAYGIPTATVVDVGHQKADITCIAEFMLHNVGRGLAVPNCGGEAMTGRLVELLSGRQGFTRDVCEQLKKSAICEVLPSDVEMPGEQPVMAGAANPAAAASTGQDSAGPGQRKQSIAEMPRGPGPDTEVGEEKKLEDEEGVLDIASIVTGGNMSGYLAQKEQEKQDKATAKQQKKASDAQQNVPKQVRLPNAKRNRSTFVYEDFVLHDAMKKAGMSTQGMADMQSALDDGPNKRQKTPEPQSAVSDKPADAGLDSGVTDTGPSGGIRREIEVGTERFQAATGGVLEKPCGCHTPHSSILRRRW